MGYVTHGQIANSILVEGSILNMQEFPNEKVRGLLKTFNLYVKFPKSRWPEIKMAEEHTPEGNRIYENLKQEFIENFWDGNSENFEQASLDV